MSLGTIIVTHKYIDGVNNKDWEPFHKRLWQRNYYERIVRNDLELQNIQQYIDRNPADWQTDSLNTTNPWGRGLMPAPHHSRILPITHTPTSLIK